MSDLFHLHGKTALVTGANTGLGQADRGRAGPSRRRHRRRRPQPGRRYRRTGAAALGAASCSCPPTFSSTAAGAARGRCRHRLQRRHRHPGQQCRHHHRADSLDVTEDDWDAVINTNLRPVFFLSQAVARHMVDGGGGGKIINIASLLSFQGGIRVPAYASSKSALAGLTRAGQRMGGARASTSTPSRRATSTPTTRPPARGRRPRARHPGAHSGRPLGQPDDLAGAAVFLASRASDYVHGIVLPVDGGWLAR
jgi:2-deoxy-D-gluconate 3-dehydrogenase